MTEYLYDRENPKSNFRQRLTGIEGFFYGNPNMMERADMIGRWVICFCCVWFQISNYIFNENYPFFPLILDISKAKKQKHLCDFEYCVYLMVGVSVNIKYSYHVINVKQYLRTPVQRAIRTGARVARPPSHFWANQLTLFQPGDRLCPLYYQLPPSPNFHSFLQSWFKESEGF